MFPSSLLNNHHAHGRHDQAGAAHSRHSDQLQGPRREHAEPVAAPVRDGSPSAVFIRSERYQLLERSFSATQTPNTLPSVTTETAAVNEPSAGALKASGNILSLIEAQLLRDSADGATSEELASRLQAGLEGFKTGFAQAAEQLEEMGFLSDEIRADITQTYDLVLAGVDELKQRFVDGDESLPAVPQTPVQEPATQGPAAFEQAYSRYDSAQKNTFSFSLTTADGDKVTIDASSLRASVTQQYAAHIDGLESLLDYSKAQSERSSFSFSVEGDLDADELAAINDLLGQVNDLAETFFSGDMEGAFEEALALGYNTSEISAFALNLSQTSVQRVTQAYEGVRGSDANSASASLAERLEPLGDFVRGVMEAYESASTFDSPRDLIEALSEWFEQSREQAFQRTVGHLLDGIEAQQ